MSYQNCPKCKANGTIMIPSNGTSAFKIDICNVCLGECIIHGEYGIPPKLVRDRIESNMLNRQVERTLEVTRILCENPEFRDNIMLMEQKIAEDKAAKQTEQTSQ